MVVPRIGEGREQERERKRTVCSQPKVYGDAKDADERTPASGRIGGVRLSFVSVSTAAAAAAVIISEHVASDIATIDWNQCGGPLALSPVFMFLT